MPRKARDVVDQLTTKFHFRRAKGKATDHLWFELEVPGVGKVMTKVSHGKTDIRDDIIKLMVRQLDVTGPIFSNMLDCTMSKADYVAHLVEAAKRKGTFRPPK